MSVWTVNSAKPHRFFVVLHLEWISSLYIASKTGDSPIDPGQIPVKIGYKLWCISQLHLINIYYLTEKLELSEHCGPKMKCIDVREQSTCIIKSHRWIHYWSQCWDCYPCTLEFLHFCKQQKWLNYNIFPAYYKGHWFKSRTVPRPLLQLCSGLLHRHILTPRETKRIDPTISKW